MFDHDVAFYALSYVTVTGVVVVVLVLGIRHPEPNGSRWATPPSLIQQRPGQSRSWLDVPPAALALKSV